MSDPTTLGRLYGRRKGHKLRRGQAALLEELMPCVEVPEHGALTSESLFDDAPDSVRPLHFEIGFGSGEHLAGQALAHPHHGFIGCEPFMNGVVGALNHIDELGLSNVRLYMGNALDVLARLHSLHPARYIGSLPQCKQTLHGGAGYALFCVVEQPACMFDRKGIKALAILCK